MKEYLREYFKLLRFTKPYKGLFFLALCCMAVSTVFDGVTLGMIVPLSDRILTNKEVIIPGDVPPALAQVVAYFNSLNPHVLLRYMVIFMIGLFFFKGVFLFLQTYLMNVIGESVIREVRDALYRKFQDLSMSFYAQKRTGELISRVTNDVLRIANALTYALTDMLYQSMQVLFFASIAFYIGFKISWFLPLISFVIFPCIMIPVVKFGKKIKSYSAEVQNKMADLNSQLAETIQGAYIIKAFLREEYEIERFREINRQYYRFTLKGMKRTIFLSPFTEFVGACGAMVLLWLIGQEVIAGRISFGVFGLFLASVLSMMRPLKKLSNAHAINQRAIAASSRIYKILEEEPLVKEASRPVEISGIDRDIRFEQVSFQYNPGEETVLKDVDFTVRRGEQIAFVGHSGAGKSTLVNLLPRFYDPTRGRILIDGRDIRELRIVSLRRLISVVSQETMLFHTTVRENIRYGKEDAGEEDLIQAAQKAHAWEFIRNLPRGMDTIVGDRGFRLSGGQKQRIAIARAILKDAPILILDEATSHLDTVAERLIKDALHVLMKGKTAFIIAHRLSTVQNADRILVIENGKITEEGRHEELLRKGTVYRTLYDLQFKV
ncbi:MAG: ATP-binding cassette domain-containing protein [Candidatus Omnitrophica bacterium]|nr:ATP-binding cassette domain-containing protein [Candidatus Omnitrophota bacterium]